MGMVKRYDESNKVKFSPEGSVIIDIAKKKGITQKEIADRLGYKDYTGVRNRLLEGHAMNIEVLKNICEVLGVELCIIDGWKKYSLTKAGANPDLDNLMVRMSDEVKDSQSDDRWGKQREKRLGQMREVSRKVRERDREAYNAKMKEYLNNQRREMPLITVDNICIECMEYEERMKRNGKGFCKLMMRYTCKDECEMFKGRNGEYLPSEDTMS